MKDLLMLNYFYGPLNLSSGAICINLVSECVQHKKSRFLKTFVFFIQLLHFSATSSSSYLSSSSSCAHDLYKSRFLFSSIFLPFFFVFVLFLAELYTAEIPLRTDGALWRG